jgi:transcriptional regulator with XRE-family HTH domain
MFHVVKHFVSHKLYKSPDLVYSISMKTNNFIEQVKKSFEEKCRKNGQFSLRSFARSLGVSPASVSGILNGKRNPSLKMIEKMGFALGLKSLEILRHQKNCLGLELAKSNQKFNTLSQDTFFLITDWYHLTILELMKLDDFNPDPKWISKRLDVNVNQIKIAIERLQRVGILEVKNNGKWIDKTAGFTTHYKKEKTTEARKQYQLQLLEKSRESLLQDDYSIRDHSGITMAINPADIGIAKDEIVEFRKKLSSILEEPKICKEVYQLQISFFPLTKKREDSL